MFKRFHHHRPHYFIKHLSKQVEELYLNVGIMDFAVAAMGLYVPIYLYTLGYRLWQIMAFYLVVYVVYVLIAPLGARYVGRHGYEKSILIASLAYAAHFVTLFSIPQWPDAWWLAAVLFAIQKAWYWPAYHADFGNFSYSGDRGSEVGGLVALDQVVYIIGPLVGGIIIKFMGFPVLFGVAIVLILLSNVPIFMTTEKVRQFRLAYREPFAYLAAPKHRRQLFAYLGFGEEALAMTVWPIFIFLVVSDFIAIGSLVAAATLVTSITTLFVGKLFDHGQKQRVIAVSTILYAVVWLVRTLARAGGSVFVIDSLQRIFKNTLYVPILADMYAHAGRDKQLVLHGVFYEQALSLGKIIAFVLVLAFALFTEGFVAAFIVGALLSLLYLVILSEDRVRTTAVTRRR